MSTAGHLRIVGRLNRRFERITVILTVANLDSFLQNVLGRYSEIAFQAGSLRSSHRLEPGSASPIRATSLAGEKRL